MTAVAFAALGLLGALIVVLIVERAIAERNWAAERRRLLNVAISRHVGDVAGFDLLERQAAKPDVEREPLDPAEVDMIGVGGN